MVQFTNAEKFDMVCIYGESGRNPRRAQILYSRRYPDRRQPSFKTYLNLRDNLVLFGTFVKFKRNRRKLVRNDQNTAEVLQRVNDNPQISLRTIQREIGVSLSSCQRILKDNKYHPFKIHLVHQLRLGDFERRIDFLARFSIMWEENASFLKNILWSDESRFHNNGLVNKHNCHYWSDQNPRWMRATNNQIKFGVNVWCGILNGVIIGPYLYEGILDGQRYLNFLRNVLPGLLNDVPNHIRQNMWFQQDGAPPHNARIVTNYLNTTFPNSWIGTNGPIKWPARSPDLTPLDFFLWGHLKNVVYEEPIDDMADLVNKIYASCGAINRHTLLATTDTELRRRYNMCVYQNGQNFEQFL